MTRWMLLASFVAPHLDGVVFLTAFDKKNKVLKGIKDLEKNGAGFMYKERFLQIPARSIEHYEYWEEEVLV